MLKLPSMPSFCFQYCCHFSIEVFIRIIIFYNFDTEELDQPQAIRFILSPIYIFFNKLMQKASLPINLVV